MEGDTAPNIATRMYMTVRSNGLDPGLDQYPLLDG